MCGAVRVDFIFTQTREVSLCSPTRWRSEQLLQSTEIQFTAHPKCALTNTGSTQISLKSLWPRSHLFVFAFEELWSYQVLLAKNIVESEFWDPTERYLQEVPFWVPPGNVCSRCAPSQDCKPHPVTSLATQIKFEDSPEQRDQKFGVSGTNLSVLIKSKAPGNLWEDFLSLQQLQVNTIMKD